MNVFCDTLEEGQAMTFQNAGWRERNPARSPWSEGWKRKVD